MKKQKIFWGIFFIVAALLIIISKLGLMPDVGVFSIFATIVLLWMLIQGLKHINFYEIMFAIAFLCIIYDEPLGIEALTPWSVLAAALLFSIGLSMLFHGKRKYHHHINIAGKSHSAFGESSEQFSDEHLICENNFSAAIRYVNSDNFRDAHLENNFGSLTVYFDNAIIQGGSAQVSIENNFGATALYIPKEWKVVKNLEHSFGNIDEYGASVGNSDTTLYIQGETNFGHIELHYV